MGNTAIAFSRFKVITGQLVPQSAPPLPRYIGVTTDILMSYESRSPAAAWSKMNLEQAIGRGFGWHSVSHTSQISLFVNFETHF